MRDLSTGQQVASARADCGDDRAESHVVLGDVACHCHHLALEVLLEVVDLRSEVRKLRSKPKNTAQGERQVGDEGISKGKEMVGGGRKWWGKGGRRGSAMQTISGEALRIS